MTRRKEVKFTTGAAVEVSCDDEGFKGAWYEANVVRHQPKRGRYSVVYNSLMSDDDDSKPLREVVSWSYLRPCPPRYHPDHRVSFDLHQAVDAYHNDGWWSGVVSRVHVEEEKRRYTVCFPSSREVLEFGPEELRVHRNWVNGEWVVPQEQGVVDTIYSIGNQVEVARIKENYRTAWFPATIVKLILKTYFLVEYESLRTDDRTDPLREIVDTQYVRPCPPHISVVKSFKQLDQVEAFYGDGWWAGLVMKIHTGSRYNVKFSHWGEEMEFSHEELRPHRDWINGRWVRFSRDKLNKVPILVMTSSDGEGISVEKSHTYSTNSMSKKVEGSASQSHSDASQLFKKLKKGAAIEARSLLDDFIMARGAKTPASVGTGCDVITPLLEDRICFHYKPYMRKRPVSKRPSNRSCSDILVGELNDKSLMLAKFNPDLSSLNRTEWPNMGKVFTERGGNGSENQSKASKECHSYFSLGSNGLLQQRKKLVAHRPRLSWEVPFDRSAGQLSTKRKRTGNRGRHAKLRITDKNAPLGGGPLGDDARKVHLVGDQQDDMEVGELSNEGHLTSQLEGITQGGSLGDDVLTVHLVSDQQENMEVGELSYEGHLTSQLEGITQGDTCVKDLVTEELSYVNASLVEISNLNIQLNEAGREADNEDLVLPSGDEVNKSFNIESGRVEADILTCSLPSRKTCLPFVKCSFLWESLESMEVFSKVSLQPHFLPLEQHSEEFREGMAIGLMVTFANLLESIPKLRISDSKEKFEERLKTLIHLEEHGFDVQCARGCLEELRRIKRDQEQLVNKKSAFEVLLLERQKEKNGLKAKTEEVDMTIMELEQSLAHFHEKKASIVKQREDNEAEIVKLQMDLRAVEKVFLFAENDFESTVGAAW